MASIFNLFNSQCSEITFTYKWTIANYSRLYDMSHPWKWLICSNKFCAPNNEDLQFELRLYPKGWCNPKGSTENWKDFVSIGVFVYDIPKRLNVTAQWNVSIEDAIGKKCATKESRDYYRLCCKFGKVVHSIEHKQLLNCASNYLSNDQLTLNLEIHLKDPFGNSIFNVITNNFAGHSRFDCAKKVSRVVHDWTIYNVADLFDEEEFYAFPPRQNSKEVKPYFIQSDHFPAALNGQNERFCLRLCPTGWTDQSKSSVDIFLCNDNEDRVIVHSKITFIDASASGGNTSHEEVWNIPAKYGGHFGYHQKTFLDDVNGLVRKNKLKIHCELSYMMDSTMENQTMIQTQIPDSVVPKSASKFDVALKTFHFVNFKFSDYCLTTSPKDASQIESEIFNLPIDQIKFQLCLLPNSPEIEQGKQYLSLELCNVSQSPVTVQYRMTVLGANGQKWLRWGDQSTITSGGSVKRTKFCLQSLLDRIPDKKLNILCELWVVQDNKKIRQTKSIKQQTRASYATVVNMSNANMQGAILNVQGRLSMDDFNMNAK